MAEETRERSTTSAGLWPEAVAADLSDSDRWLYFMKGTGSDRDMRLALGVLRAWLQSHFGDITAEDITAESVSVVGSNALVHPTCTAGAVGSYLFGGHIEDCCYFAGGVG